MARIKNPLLFSDHFGLNQSIFENEGFIDPFLNVDTQLFIDPVLLNKSSFNHIRNAAYTHFKEHFSKYVRLLVISERRGDAAWKAASKLLDLREPPQTGLGYGGSSRSGSSRPAKVKDAILNTSKEIVELGSKDPEMISLMGFFEEGVGPDTISDFTTRVIMNELGLLTEAFCAKYAVDTYETGLIDGTQLPRYDGSSVVLVPRDIVRDLPIANDWSDIEAAAMHSKEIRERVNSLLSGIARPTVADRKAALRAAALGTKEDFDHFVNAVKDNATYYNPTQDALAYYKIREIFREDPSKYKTDSKYDLRATPSMIEKIALDTIDHFKHHVEKGNLWEELWISDSPKKERASQLIYYAIADCFCHANNIDISPEANMGGGPIDFKYSKGYEARVLVELKKSTGAVVHGYEKQLEIYKDASRTSYGVFVVIDVGRIGNKLDKIFKIRDDRVARGERASKIIVIDAKRKESASKRR